jgi:hypothetical protein
MDVKAPEEMAAAVDVYTDYILSIIKEESIVGIEKKFDLSWLVPGMFGTNDCMVYNPSEQRLHVIDYKHGAGLAVYPDWNPQLMIYALGAIEMVEKQGHVVDQISVTIVQPRKEANELVRTWEVGNNSLMFWARRVLKPGALDTMAESPKYKIGKYCRFCPAIAVCPEQIKNACAVAKTDFDCIDLPNPKSLSAEEIDKVIQSADIFSSWAKGVKEFAQDLLLQGYELPNHKLVKVRANRKWVDEEAVFAKLYPVLGEKLVDKKLVSVAKAERLLKAHKIRKETISDLYRSPSGVKIAHRSDKRQAVGVSSAKEDFLDYTDIMR